MQKEPRKERLPLKGLNRLRRERISIATRTCTLGRNPYGIALRNDTLELDRTKRKKRNEIPSNERETDSDDSNFKSEREGR